jgi:hypothetical protein
MTKNNNNKNNKNNKSSKNNKPTMKNEPPIKNNKKLEKNQNPHPPKKIVIVISKKNEENNKEDLFGSNEEKENEEKNKNTPIKDKKDDKMNEDNEDNTENNTEDNTEENTEEGVEDDIFPTNNLMDIFDKLLEEERKFNEKKDSKEEEKMEDSSSSSGSDDSDNQENTEENTEEYTEEYTEDDYRKEQLLNDEIEKELEKNARKRKFNRFKDNSNSNNNGGKNNNEENSDKNNGEKQNRINFLTNDREFNNLLIMGILGRPPMNNDDSGDDDHPHLLRLNKKRKQNKSVEDFYEYFKNTKDLKPISMEVKSLDDLIKLGETYDPKDKNKYVINMKALHKCLPTLKELNSMIGMKNIKEMVMDLIFFRLQNFEDDKEELWHLVIQGSPGCGKTEVSKILGKLYYGLGIVKNEKFMIVKRSDLIGKYLGHTAKQTQQVFDDAEGGVLFIDEAYSLGNPEGRDSFAKECIDTINLNLTEKKNTVVIIAGYKDQLNESFFNYNPGLNRRFKMRLTVDTYDAAELRNIYIKKLKENKWKILEDNEEKELPLSFFEKNRSSFKFNGGDIENLWHMTKIVHARRVFGKSYDLVKKITFTDLENALKMYSDNDEFKKRGDDLEFQKYLQNTMYS